MRSALTALAFFALLPAAAVAETQTTPSAKDAKVFIIEPKDGTTVASPVTVKFGIEGMQIAPAGTDQPNSGHHHLVIDTELTDFKSPVPADANHIHFGKGQTEATVELKPGEHTLQLVLGDKNHVPHDPPVVSPKIKITVK